MTIGEKIKYLRKQYFITGEELSKMTGINHSLIKKYECDYVIPKADNLNKIAKAFGLLPEILTDAECDITSKWSIQKWCDKQINKYQYQKLCMSYTLDRNYER